MPAELNLEERELCSDGACIGVIGGDGRCKECGKPGKAPKGSSSSGRKAAPVEREQKRDEDDDDSFDASDDDDDDDGDESIAAAADDEDRELCPDGACIGVIGDDGRCKVCGTSKDA